MELRAIGAFYDSRQGLVEVDDDVLSIVSQIRERYGDRVKVCWEPTAEYFVLSEVCEDQTERLIFVTPELDGRVLIRLMQADAQVRGHEDPYDAAEREQDSHFDALEEQSREKVREHGEALAHGLKKDGVMPRLPLQISVPRSVDA